MLRIIGIIALFFHTFLLSACTTTAPSAPSTQMPERAVPTNVSNWEARKAALSQIQSWQVSGKIAIKTAQDAGSASLNWSEKRGNYTFSVTGPLGSHSFNLKGQPGNVTLETSDGKQITASTPEELLAKEGLRLPVSYIKYWIRGLPVPSVAANTRFDNDNRLTQLLQQGWRIQYQGYTRVGNVDLPNKLSITSSQLTAKIIIYKWNLPH